MTTPPLTVISLGWGVQSFTLAAMSALGELPPVDAALHADTTHESALTYDFARRWTPWLEAHGVRVVTVKNPTGGMWEILKRPGQTHVPLFTNHANKGDGQLNRSCTQRWKITPMRRWVAAELERRELSKTPGVVEQWLGISLDEFQRMKDSDVKYIANRWPLIERRKTRQDCIKWLEAHGLEVPPKSACTFCPFHSTAEWRRIKSNPADWAEAVAVDNAIRKARPPYDLFVHPSRRPLETVDLRTEQERGQLELWDSECSGVCGV